MKCKGFIGSDLKTSCSIIYLNCCCHNSFSQFLQRNRSSDGTEGQPTINNISYVVILYKARKAIKFISSQDQNLSFTHNAVYSAWEYRPTMTYISYTCSGVSTTP